jgi:glycine/D-amino acid oxidase-like deaminating enzyme
MQTSVIIVGQGLCGTWLSYWLQQAGIDFLVIDEERPNTSTRVASGVINPVTGRRMSRTWLADQVIPFAEQAYTSLTSFLSTVNNQPSTPLISRCDIMDFFNSPDRRLDFEKKATQFAEYLQWPKDEHYYRPHFHYELGYGIIAPAYQVDLQTMLDGWRQYLKQSNRLLEQRFDHAALQLMPNGVQYGDIHAGKIIFTEGVAAHEAGFFQLLPFALNKGEALIVEIDSLPADHIYKKGNTITPWRGGYFWAGSTYNNHYTDDQPTAAFRQSMEAWLSSVLKHPFKVLDHLAAIRPATVERRPFAGWHPQHVQVGILNGTGTKGVTLAPFFAKQMADNITQHTAIMPEADVARFARVLQRS